MAFELANLGTGDSIVLPLSPLRMTRLPSECLAPQDSSSAQLCAQLLFYIALYMAEDSLAFCQPCFHANPSYMAVGGCGGAGDVSPVCGVETSSSQLNHAFNCAAVKLQTAAVTSLLGSGKLQLQTWTSLVQLVKQASI